ncbi:MAG: phosphatase PAP2 family protein [Clostridia bacterium]|nr:phosphatase PAP2 family protein [Clostridia bacterium]
MEFLRFLENLRTPWLDQIMLFITSFGEELVFIGIAVTLLWCINKYQGYYMLSVGFIGMQINQLLKVLFRIERPWVRDPSFEAVEAAKAQATGYSFPSGHTQNSVGTFGSIARWCKTRWISIVCWTLAVLVAFSRMYLGVHTPADVLVSFGIAVILVFALYPLFRDADKNPRRVRILLCVLLVWAIAQILFMEFFSFPAEAQGERLYSGLKNAYKIAGVAIGFIIAFELDLRYIRFETKAVWWAQVIKLIVGLALTFGVKELGGLVFDMIPYEPVGKALEYLVMVLFAACVWPLTFRWFAGLGKKGAA